MKSTWSHAPLAEIDLSTLTVDGIIETTRRSGGIHGGKTFSCRIYRL